VFVKDVKIICIPAACFHGIVPCVAHLSSKAFISKKLLIVER